MAVIICRRWIFFSVFVFHSGQFSPTLEPRAFAAVCELCLRVELSCRDAFVVIALSDCLQILRKKAVFSCGGVLTNTSCGIVIELVRRSDKELSFVVQANWCRVAHFSALSWAEREEFIFLSKKKAKQLRSDDSQSLQHTVFHN